MHGHKDKCTTGSACVDLHVLWITCQLHAGLKISSRLNEKMWPVSCSYSLFARLRIYRCAQADSKPWDYCDSEEDTQTTATPGSKTGCAGLGPMPGPFAAPEGTVGVDPF